MKKAVKPALPQRSALITARVVSAAVVTSSAMTIVVDLRVAEVATRTGAALEVEVEGEVEAEATEEVRVLNLLVLFLSDLGALNYHFYYFKITKAPPLSEGLGSNITAVLLLCLYLGMH